MSPITRTRSGWRPQAWGMLAVPLVACAVLFVPACSQPRPTDATPAGADAAQAPAPAPSVPRVRTVEDVRTALATLDRRLETIALYAELDTWLALPDGSWRTEPEFAVSYELAADRERFRQITARPEDEIGHREVYVYADDRVTIWMPNDIGPGVGIIRTPHDYDDLQRMRIHWALPLKTMEALFRFDLEKTAFVIDGEVEHGGVPGVQISWGNTYQHCRAVLVREYGWSPVYLERSYDGVVDYTCSFEAFVPATADAPAYPTRLTHRLIRPTTARAPKLPDDLPQEVRDAEKVVHVQRYELVGLELNHPLPADAFTVKWDRGTEVLDQIEGEAYYFLIPDSERPWPEPEE